MHAASRSSSALKALAVALPLALLLAACGGLGGARTDGEAGARGGGPPVVATWTGETLTLDEFEEAYAGTVASWDSAAADSMAEYRDFLERYVNFRLKVKQARELGLDRDSALRAEVADYRDQLARPYFLDQQVLDAIVRDLYRKQQEEVRASHLLLQVAPDALPADTLAAYTRALALRDSIVTHGVPFEAVARRHSNDSSVLRNGGDLGYFTGGRMVHQFEDAAYATPVGEVSQPVRTRFGYHLIHVADRRARTAEISASHILIRPQGATPEDSAAARRTIEELRARVQAGEDFATLARQYSDDVAGGRRGGDLGYFGLGRMVGPFEQAAFALGTVGELSPPVVTPFGFHLIQLTGRRALPSLAEAYNDLKRTAAELPLADERAQELGARLRVEGDATYDDAVVEAALARFDPDSLLAQIGRDGFGPDSATVFATIDGQPFTLGTFAALFARGGPRPGPDQRAQVRTEMDRYLNAMAVERAIATLDQRDPAFRRLLQQYEDGVLLFRISEDSVWTQAGTDEVTLRTFHATRAAEYRLPQRRRVLAFGTPSDSLLRQVARDLDGGRAPAEILAAYRDSPLTLRLDTVYVADSTNTALDLVLGLQPGQHTEVVPERSRLAVYLLDAVEPPRQKTFEEARAEVVSAYQDVLEAAWVRRLRDRYDAETFPERLAPAFRGPRPPAGAPGDPPGGSAGQ